METYFLNGLQVYSEVELPCIPSSSGILRDTTPLQINYGGCEPGPFSQVHWLAQRPWSRSYDLGDSVLVCATKDFKMRVNNEGTKITLFYDPATARAKALAVACAINLGIAVCSLFRGQLPLHAASAEIGGQLIGVLAPSGTGKTTTLWHMLDQGAKLCSDDMTTVQLTPAAPLAWPSQSQHAKLSLESLEYRNTSPVKYKETFPQSEEFWIPVQKESRLMTPRPLDALFVLTPKTYLATTRHILTQRLRGAATFPLLCDNMQGLWPVHSKINTRQFFQDCLELAERVPFYILEYSRSYDALPSLVNLMCDLSRYK